MAYYNQNYNYPKNWNCNGLGWINPAAFAQSPPANQWPTVPSPGSSGYSSLSRDGSSISGQSLSYGFSPGVMPPLPASPYGSGYPAAGGANLPYPTMGFAAFGGGGGPSSSDFGIPNLPPAVPQSLLQGGGPAEPDSTCQEIPFQSISVPIAEGMFSPLETVGLNRRSAVITMDELKGLLGGAGRQLFDAAGQAITSAATEYIGSVINEMFVKKETDTKRFLPSIKNMKVTKMAGIVVDCSSSGMMITP
ncbi:hypothetical protein AND_003678 [Anopheles darlingi]|uniref:Uncharacterized protein n=1 Tax=Anopheles darlingi TaxID=43151 RepID=W5JNV1_ANODA|nr:hypothetical protein AND_003678 [Anopheles darlingi]